MIIQKPINLQLVTTINKITVCLEAEKTQEKKRKKIENFSYLSFFAHLSRHVVVVVVVFERKWIEKKGSLCFVCFAVLVFLRETLKMKEIGSDKNFGFVLY